MLVKTTKSELIIMYIVMAAGYFFIGCAAMWPEPIFENYWFDVRHFSFGLNSGLFRNMILENTVNAFIVLFMFLMSFLIVLQLIRLFTKQKKGDYEFPKSFLLFAFPGVIVGFLWNASVGITHYQFPAKKEYPYVMVKHWRPEIREFTGMDFILGIDLTIPNAPRFDDKRKAEIEAVHELVMKGYHAASPAERKTLRDQALKERLASDEVYDRLYGHPWKQWHEAMYADPANDCRHKLFCTTSGNEFKIAAEHEWENKKTQRDYARHHNIVLYEN